MIVAMLQASAPHWHPDFIHRHPYTLLVAALVYGQAVNAMPAPTAKSSQFYVFTFKFLTGLNNLVRAWSTQVEKSPNWQDAVDLHIKTNSPGPDVPQEPKNGGG